MHTPISIDCKSTSSRSAEARIMSFPQTYPRSDTHTALLDDRWYDSDTVRDSAAPSSSI